MLKALCIDFDGTLFHIERIHQECVASVVEEHLHTTIEPGESRALAGIPYMDRIEHMLGLRGIHDRERVVQLEAIARQRMTQRLQHKQALLTPGVPDFLKRATDAGLRLSVVSSAATQRIHEDLKEAGIDHFFEFVIGLDDVVQRKPDPEPYLKALENFQVSASETVAFEDTPHGIASSAAAGIPTVGIKTTFDDNDLAAAAYTVNDFTEISITDLQQLTGTSA
jgi:HAD superfamily hydrolase (TIGR01509 family)